MQWKGHRDVEPGEWIYANDISDVRQVVFENVVFPEDAGVVVVLSVGWRRAMFFDFGPLPPHLAPRDYDLGVLLGGYYSYLLFRNVFELSDQNWQLLLDQQWFPFVPLNRGTFDKIIEHAKKGKRIDDLLPEIRSDLDSVLPGQMKRWANTAAFEPHMAFIQKAYEQYLANDHISCLSILFPRIEGVLRTFQKLMGDPTRANQRDLADVVVSDGVNPRHPVYSPLLPIWFNRYLAECYFAHFDPKAESHSLSRNTVGHGVAGADVFNEKGCVLGFLVLCQLGLYFGGVEGTQHE
jgi:hypothetical protein